MGRREYEGSTAAGGARGLGTQFARLGLALSLYVMSPAQAATEFSFDLPAQPMIESLQAIVQTSGVQLRYASEAVDGLTAPAVKASLDLEAAYSAVLAGSGLRPRFAADGAVVVAPDGAATQALVPVIELPPADLPGEQLQRQDQAAVRLDTTVVTGTPSPLGRAPAPRRHVIPRACAPQW